MKVISYIFTEEDQSKIQAHVDELVSQYKNSYTKWAEGQYSSSELDSQLTLNLPKYVRTGIWYAVFKLLEQDGFLRLDKEADKYSTFEDHCGDTFCPKANPDIDKAELKRQKARERARFNRKGCWGHILTYLPTDTELEACWGFVGDDFYGSGYDTDFYRSGVSHTFKSANADTYDYLKAIRKFLSTHYPASMEGFRDDFRLPVTPEALNQ